MSNPTQTEIRYSFVKYCFSQRIGGWIPVMQKVIIVYVSCHRYECNRLRAIAQFRCFWVLKHGGKEGADNTDGRWVLEMRIGYEGSKYKSLVAEYCGNH